ncbi:MAG: TolC family protein, partial [Candidatus Eisenbacteria bacterium]
MSMRRLTPPNRAPRPARPFRFLLVLAALVGVAPAGSAFAQAMEPLRGEVGVEQAVQLALERNQDLLISGENVEVASGAKKQALQAYLPRINASGSYSHSFNQSGYFDPTTQSLILGSQDNYGVRYVLSQNLIDIASMRNIAAAGKDLQASKLANEFSRADLVLGVKQQYYALVAAQDLASVSDSALALSDRELLRTQSLFELGMVAKSDVLKAQVRVASGKLDLIRERGIDVIERARLARIL